MNKGLLSLLLIFFISLKQVGAQSYGLIFSSFEAVQERRTCLNLTNSETICLKKDFDLTFDLAFIPRRPAYFGYIFRIINKSGQNIDLLFNPKSSHFYLVFKENYTKIDFEFGRINLLNNWAQFRLHRKGDKLLFYVNEKLVGQTNITITDDCFELFFGACSAPNFKTTDIPPMKVRNIRLSIESKIKHAWLLKESEGTVCSDSMGKKNGVVVNPVWIAPLFTNWRQVLSRKFTGIVNTAFDASSEQLYIIAHDSVLKYSLKQDSLRSTLTERNTKYEWRGSQSFYDPFNHNLYNLYIDDHLVSRFNPENNTWENRPDSAGLSEFWQANKFVSSSTNSLYSVGGYGQLTYKNEVQQFNLTDGSWKKLNPSGDYLSPRYLAALGTTSTGDTAYVLGGFGSQSGAQELSPKYSYDLLMYDVKKNAFKKLITLKKPREEFVLGNSLVLDQDSKGDYYALTFPKDRFNSVLQLIRGNLNSSDYTQVGDTIPFSFNDIRSFADLYWCKENQQLLAVTLLINENQTSTEVKVYSIFFPPNISVVLPVTSVSKKGSSRGLYIVFGVAILLVLIFLIARKGGSKNIGTAIVPETEKGMDSVIVPANTTLPVRTPVSEPVKPVGPAIMLFGSFEVIDRDGNNITKLFTPLLQKLFLLITIYSIRTGHGISSENLNEILWSDKSEKDARNNRFVNLAKLKSIFEKLGNILISKESGNWLLEFDPAEIRIDMFEFYRLAGKKKEIEKSAINELLQIIGRGSFLHQLEFPWLDDVKSEVSNKALDLLVEAGKNLHSPANAEQMVEIADYIFNFDQINENALILKCQGLSYLGRHSLAKNAYEKFARDYKHMYGEDFDKSYTSIVSD